MLIGESVIVRRSRSPWILKLYRDGKNHSVRIVTLTDSSAAGLLFYVYVLSMFCRLNVSNVSDFWLVISIVNIVIPVAAPVSLVVATVKTKLNLPQPVYANWFAT